MRERTTSTITIYRAGQTVLTVPITEQCRRTFSLMSQDSITLDFSIRSAVHIAIGDYINDELFGKFYVCREQMPQYDTATGSYHYTIQLDAEYMTWANRKFMMTLDNNGVRVRKEASWRLTSDLATQVAEIIKNVEILGYHGYTYHIHPTATTANEVKLMQYAGTSIIDALNQIADTWQCEWWVTTDHTIHLGKCEASNDPLQLSLDTNVEQMSIADNRNTYANKIYVYGSTQNLPPTYRKELQLLTTDHQVKDGMHLWYIDKRLTPKMFPAVIPLYLPINVTSSTSTTGKVIAYTYSPTAIDIDYPSAYSISTPSVTFSQCYLIPDQYSGQGQQVPAGTRIRYTRHVQLILIIGSTQQVICENTIEDDATMSSGNVPGFPIQDITLPSISIQSIQMPIGQIQLYIRQTISNETYIMAGVWGQTVSPSQDIYLNIEPIGTGIIKVHKQGDIITQPTINWTTGQYYRTGSIMPTLQAAGVTGYKMSQMLTIQPGQTYTTNLTVPVGTAAVVFFNRVGNVVGWIDGRGSATDYSWNNTEHLDAATYRITTTAITPGPLSIKTINQQVWERYARINAIGAQLGDPDSYALSFCQPDGTVTADVIPADMAIFDRIIVNEESITVRVPSAYFSTQFDNPSALSAIGDTRLQMPAQTDGYILLDSATESNAVEEVVTFDDIYPRLDLVVDSIQEYPRTDRIEYQGEDETSDWQWIEYTLKLRQANGEPFQFSDEYLLPGQKLQLKFLTHQDLDPTVQAGSAAAPCRLAGMTFDVEYRKSGEYIIGRNEEYGAKLPNDTLRPNIGDPCLLLGWNPRAIGSLGLIDQAEQRLKSKATEYKAALEEGQFTFDLTMMADFLFDQIPYLRLYDAEDKRVKDSSDYYIWVKNGYNAYLVPTEGTRVTITHGALASPKQSRIIGYKLKLDKPYDSPSYTIGETQAYSRLAKIERELSKINS